MQIYPYATESAESASLMTEIQYAVAAAKVSSKELLLIHFVSASYATIKTVLTKIKKSRKISLFLAGSELDNDSAEASYIHNKFPELSLDKETMGEYVIVKI